MIRCVLYLSDSNYNSLKYYVTTANVDRRDVYYWAEYDWPQRENRISL